MELFAQYLDEQMPSYRLSDDSRVGYSVFIIDVPVYVIAACEFMCCLYICM